MSTICLLILLLSVLYSQANRGVSNTLTGEIHSNSFFTPIDLVYSENLESEAEKDRQARRLAKVEPDLTHQSKEEKNYLKLHKCRDSGEAYGAAYLITKEHLLYQNTAYNLTWVNCEMGSFIMMNGRADPNRNVNGTIIQTLDVLDFSVIHLSAYERLQRRWAHSLPKESRAGSIEPVVKSAQFLKELAFNNSRQKPTLSQLNRTVAIMPFLGSDMGAGHSKLNNRLQYLHACFWSIYAYIPNVVAMVKSEKDYTFAKESSGLPFFDVVLCRDLPKSASLPVSTVQHAKQFIQNGSWNFDYVYFTESDQILMLRHPEVLYEHLSIFPRRIIIPHRLMPYPKEVLTFHHKRQISSTNFDENNELSWEKYNCCIARQNCGDRKSWISVSNESVPIVNAFGLLVPLGNTNFHQESYRTCKINTAGDWDVCP